MLERGIYYAYQRGIALSSFASYHLSRSTLSTLVQVTSVPVNDRPGPESDPPERLLRKLGYFNHPILYVPPPNLQSGSDYSGRALQVYAFAFERFHSCFLTYACPQYCDTIICLDFRDSINFSVYLLCLLIPVLLKCRVDLHKLGVAAWEKKQEEQAEEVKMVCLIEEVYALIKENLDYYQTFIRDQQ